MKLVIAIILIIVAYAYCYFIIPKDISILQTSIKDFDFSLLHRRQPLVIEDTLPDDTLSTVIHSWFSPNIITRGQSDGSNNNNWIRNNYKYLYMYAFEDTELLLYQAGQKVVNGIPDNAEPVIAIKMKAFQSVIIPYRWYYNIKNNYQSFGIHDYVTYVIDLLV
jgi:hypothetical protein